MRVTRRLWRAAVALTLAASGASLMLGQCTKPSGEKQAEVTTYVMKKYHVSQGAGLMLNGVEAESSSCFWRLRYTTTTPHREITVLLTPDGEHLVPAVYDMKVDPLLEEKQKSEEASKALTAGSPLALGPASAPVTIVEFSDFQCPYCKRLTDVLEQEVLPKHRDQVRVVFRSFPLPIHSWAKPAAVIAECAGLQDGTAFWAMHDYLFRSQQLLHPETIKEQAGQFAATLPNLNQTQFQACVDRDLGLGPVMQDEELGQKFGVHATPTFFVNGVRFDGAHTGAEIEAMIQKATSGELAGTSEHLAVPPGTIDVAVAPRTSRANQCVPVTR